MNSNLMQMKGKFSNTIDLLNSSLEKLDQNSEIHAYPYIWNSMLRSGALLHSKSCFIASIKLLCPITKNTSCHTWMVKHWAIHTFIPFILSHWSYLLNRRTMFAVPLGASGSVSDIKGFVYRQCRRSVRRITLISLHSRKV